MRSTRPLSAGSTNSVSCSSRAGWSPPKFSASKLNHSCSTSGPSATSQPIATKTSATRSEIVVSGWRAPTGRRGQDGDVDGLLDQHPGVALVLELGAAGVVAPPCTACRTTLTRLPASAFSGAGQAADRPAGQRHGRAVTDARGAGGGEVVERAGGGEGGERLVAGLLEGATGTAGRARARCSSSRRVGVRRTVSQRTRAAGGRQRAPGARRAQSSRKASGVPAGSTKRNTAPPPSAGRPRSCRRAPRPGP